MCDQSDFDEFLELIGISNVKQVILTNFKNPFSLEWLKKLASKVSILKVFLDSLDINEHNVSDFITFLATMKNYEVVNFGLGSYVFTAKDLELMLKLNLKITYISTRAFSKNNEISNLPGLANVLKKMKYLKEFRLSLFDLEDQEPELMESLADLPIKYMSSENFRFEAETIERVVGVLSKMKQLIDFRFDSNCGLGFEMSPKEFVLFKDLPVKFVHLDNLDLSSVNNIIKFGEIMKEMRIEKIDGDNKYNTDKEEFKIFVEKFGPGGIYKTIAYELKY